MVGRTLDPIDERKPLQDFVPGAIGCFRVASVSVMNFHKNQVETHEIDMECRLGYPRLCIQHMLQ